MRKLIVFNMVSVDGYFADADGKIGWHTVDNEFNDYALEFLRTVDTILFGRVTYQLFKDFWPHAREDSSLTEADYQIADMINAIEKIVVSITIEQSDWQNTTVWQDLDAAKVQELKNRPGKDIVIYGSGTIVQQLTNMGLIDDYRLMVAPVVLGAGKSMFKDVKQFKLKKVATQEFANGNTLLAYQRNVQ